MKQKPTVKLLGNDGNAFMVLALVEKGLKKAGYTSEEIAEYKKDAMSGDYENLLNVTAKWVVIE